MDHKCIIRHSISNLLLQTMISDWIQTHVTTPKTKPLLGCGLRESLG